MTHEEAAKLQPGDDVFWNDPDNGACSRYYRIQAVRVCPDNGENTVAVITDVDGSELECFIKELS